HANTSAPHPWALYGSPPRRIEPIRVRATLHRHIAPSARGADALCAMIGPHPSYSPHRLPTGLVYPEPPQSALQAFSVTPRHAVALMNEAAPMPAEAALRTLASPTPHHSGVDMYTLLNNQNSSKFDLYLPGKLVASLHYKLEEEKNEVMFIYCEAIETLEAARHCRELMWRATENVRNRRMRILI